MQLNEGELARAVHGDEQVQLAMFGAVAAAAASKFAREATVSLDASYHMKLAAVRTAILLARPSRA